MGHILIPHSSFPSFRPACKMRVLFCGSDLFFLTILNGLPKETGHSRSSVWSQPAAKPKGDSRKFTEVEELTIPHHSLLWPDSSSVPPPSKLTRPTHWLRKFARTVLVLVLWGSGYVV
ncbi:hypothetical protein PGTUg99_035827 [Puccinia graminis f. sp. tritici]|uniref:Uncharacterized protein n=1 Tax=Puccinia graminis f. sp. tritici TaxID=56615 RepID=A0A5B0P5U6_PUCGR|nr:hypothetical protein PGTUg99_035827 [Puccinia graminis f. sp. tritici]